MPKFIGNTITGSRGVSKAPRGAQLVKLSYSQAVKLPATEVYYELDTSDRGSRGSLAKRWHRWYATVEAIESCQASTANMRGAARDVRHSGALNLAHNLAAVARAHLRGLEWIYRLVNNVAYAGCARIGHRKLVETDLVNEPDLNTWTEAGKIAVDVVSDALPHHDLTLPSVNGATWITAHNTALAVVENYQWARTLGKLKACA